MRERFTEYLDFLGISVYKEKNASARGVECDVSADDSKVKVLVVPTNEELMIARETAQLLK